MQTEKQYLIIKTTLHNGKVVTPGQIVKDRQTSLIGAKKAIAYVEKDHKEYAAQLVAAYEASKKQTKKTKAG